MVVQRTLNGVGFSTGGRNDHESKLASSNERKKLTDAASLSQIQSALAGDVIRRSAEIHTDQFQDIRVIQTMRRAGERDWKPGTPCLNFGSRQS